MHTLPPAHFRNIGFGQLIAASPPSFYTVPQIPSAPIFKMVVVGDIHAGWKTVHEIISHEFPNGNGLLLSVGDTYTYPKLPAGCRMLFAPGNHENFDLLRMMHSQWGINGQRYHPLFAGDVALAGGLAIAGMPGIFHEDHFDTRENCPSKFFTRAMVRAMKQIDLGIDIMLMHEGPGGIGFTKKGTDVGSTSLTGVIEHLSPQLAFFGHYHKSWQTRLGETEIFGLEYPNRSYMVVEKNSDNGRIKVVEKRSNIYPGKKKGAKVAEYGWQRGEPDRWTRVVFEGK